MKALLLTLTGALALGFLACSTTSSSDDDGTEELGDCEALCKKGEGVNCGGQSCIAECKADKAKSAGGCESEADAYFACVRGSDSVSCSGGLLSFYGCSDETAAFYQCLANQGEGGGDTGGGGAGGGGATTSTTAQGTSSSSTGGPAYVCESAEAQGGLGCPDADPDNCVCYGCDASASCTAEVDCTCTQCANDSFCGSNCLDDGVCNPYFEGCQCADCASIPQCN